MVRERWELAGVMARVGESGWAAAPKRKGCVWPGSQTAPPEPRGRKQGHVQEAGEGSTGACGHFVSLE